MMRRTIRKNRTRSKQHYTALPVLVVSRSNKHIMAQVSDAQTRKTLFTVSSTQMKGTKTEKAQKVGELVADKAKSAKIKQMVFQRNGYKYHGRIKAMVEYVRKNGIRI